MESAQREGGLSAQVRIPESFMAPLYVSWSKNSLFRIEPDPHFELQLLTPSFPNRHPAFFGRVEDVSYQCE
jgi:hypothetical protein